MITKAQSKLLIFLVENKIRSVATCMIDPESFRVQQFPKG